MRTRDQERAIHAYERVEEVPFDPSARDAYRSLVRSLGPLVMRSGIVVALAYLQRREKEPHYKLVLQHLAQGKIPGLAAEAEEPANELCRQARGLDVASLMLATREALKVIEWLKRAAEGTFDKGAR